MHLRILKALLGLTLCGPVAASAQATVYHRSSADTLHYQETTRVTLDFSTPQGAFTVHSTQDGTISLAFGAADSARAWYEALAIRAESPQGTQTPATDELLRQPFVLRFQPTGRVETLATPSFPTSLQGVADLTRQFFDFFIPLPDAPLRVGTSWTDTTRVEGPVMGGGSNSTQRVARNEVVSDSVIDGTPVLVVRSEAEIHITTTAPGPSPDAEIFNAIRGQENGFFYFDAAGGRMVGRTQTGDLSGDLEVRGPQAMTLGQQLRFERTVRLLP